MSTYLLPDVGEGLTEAEIVTWRVAVGDVIAINDIVVEIETAKSLVELPSPYAGEVTALLVDEGETVAVGTPIIAVRADDDALGGSGGEPGEAGTGPQTRGGSGASGAAPMEIDLSNPAASGGSEGESLVGRNKAERDPVRRARKVASGTLATHMQTQAAFEPAASPLVEQAEPDDAVPVVDQRAAERPARVLAKPPVRKLAKDLGVDLAAVVPSGPGDTVTRGDVLDAHNATPGTDPAAFSSELSLSSTDQHARETREPVKGVRRMMASAMTTSAFSAPHVTEWVTVDATATVELVARLQARREFRELKVSPLLVLARAALLALRRRPILNSRWDEAAQEVVIKHYVNLGIAAATPRGLVVPNVKDAGQLSLVELAGALGELTATARAGRSQPADQADGTFTITNVGVFGVDAGTPIINPGESAILCFGAIRKQPWVVPGPDGGDQIAVRHVTTLALSFDHRRIVGASGSQFLADVAAILTDPGLALL